MASHIGKKLILQTSLSDFDVQMLQGNPFYRRYDDFSRLFIRYFPGISFESTFAFPVENKLQETLDWYISTNGTPRKLTELIGTTDYDRYRSQRDQMFAQISSLNTKNNPSLATYLNYIIFKDPLLLDEATYCCDGQVIIAFWGLTLRKGHQFTPVITDKTDDKRVYKIDFSILGQGSFTGNTSITRQRGYVLTSQDVPTLSLPANTSFVRWEPSEPENVKVTSDTTFIAVTKTVEPKPVIDIQPIPEPVRIVYHKVWFVAGQNASLNGEGTIEVADGEKIPSAKVPTVTPDPDYDFIGWNSIINAPVTSNTSVQAILKLKPWKERFLNWLIPIGLLIILFVILLISLIGIILAMILLT